MEIFGASNAPFIAKHAGVLYNARIPKGIFRTHMMVEREPTPKLINYRLLGPERILMEPDDETIQLSSPTIDTLIGGQSQWSRDFSIQTYKQLNDKDRLDLRIVRTTLLYIFTDPDGDPNVQPRSLSDILPLYKHNEPLKRKALERLAHYMTSSYYPDGTLSQKEQLTMIQSATTKANEFIEHFESPSSGMLRDFDPIIGVNNEVQAISNPIDLALITLSPKASRKMRFEARRNLVLIDLALRDMAYTQQEHHQTQDIEAFMRFLNTTLWRGGSGQTAIIEMVSTHSPTDYACKDVTFLPPIKGTFQPFEKLWFQNNSVVARKHQSMNLRLDPYHRYTAFQARVWEDKRGNLQWAVFDHRTKRDIDKMIKMMRKDTKNPRVIDDVSGFKFIFENKGSIRLFLDTLQEHAAKNGFLFSVTDASDSIDNPDDYHSPNKGSNSKVEMVKLNIQFQGHDIQLLIHTPRSYLDYQYREGTGWAFYEINRAIDSGLLDHLYPKDIYGVNFQILKEELLKTRQRELQAVSYASIPKERRRNSALQTEYTSDMKDQDVWKLDSQFKAVGFTPKIIYCIGENVLPVAVALNKKYHSELAIWQKEINEVQPAIPEGINQADILILDDVAVKMQTAKDVQSVFPKAKVAFLVDKRPKTGVKKGTVIDFCARKMPGNVWVQFPMTSHPWDIFSRTSN